MRRNTSAIVLLLLFAIRAQAENALGYVAPPYGERLLRSVVFLGVAGGVLAAALLLVFRPAADRRARVRRYSIGFAILLAVASLVAASDSQNDEGWNPEYLGSFFLAPLLPVAAATLRPPWVRPWVFLLAVLLTPAFWYATFKWFFFVSSAGFEMSW